MYDINEMPPVLDDKLLSLLSQCETPTIGHFETTGFLDPQIRALLPKAKVAGVAVTLSLPNDDGTILNHAFRLFRPGDVLVIDRQGDNQHACWGEVLTVAAKEIGIAGVIINGLATDISAIKKMQFPVWAKGVSALTTKLTGKGGSINQPITIGNEKIFPGNIVLADENGIVIMKKERVKKITETALLLQHQEEALLTKIRQGAILPDLTRATELIEKANKSH